MGALRIEAGWRAEDWPTLSANSDSPGKSRNCCRLPVLASAANQSKVAIYGSGTTVARTATCSDSTAKAAAPTRRRLKLD